MLQHCRLGGGRLLLVAVIGSLINSVSIAQTLPVASSTNATAAKPRLTFEVASVKAATDADHGPRFDLSPDGAINTKMDLSFLLLMAYHVKDFQMIGFPKAMDSPMYRIVAKPPEGSPAVDQATRSAQLAERLQCLLEERFHLQVHRETRELLVYDLVVAKGGSKLKEVPVDPAFKLKLLRGRIVANGGTTALLASLMENQLSRPVTDKTGLSGHYAIDLQFALDTVPDDPRPSLFTALQEQLGLKLEARKGPSEVLVIDHVEKPSEN